MVKLLRKRKLEKSNEMLYEETLSSLAINNQQPSSNAMLTNRKYVDIILELCKFESCYLHQTKIYKVRVIYQKKYYIISISIVEGSTTIEN